MNILAIGAHPDDIELGCAGTLISASTIYNHSIYGLVLSSGEGGGDGSERKIEMEESAKILNLNKLFCGDLPDTKISEGIETISIIEKIIHLVKPDIILTHTVEDRHQDHRNTALATFSAARNIPNILCYESPSNIHGFSPQYFISIDEAIDKKLESLKCFTTQFGKNYLDKDTILGLAKFRGYQGQVKYAEAFEVNKITKKNLDLF